MSCVIRHERFTCESAISERHVENVGKQAGMISIWDLAYNDYCAHIVVMLSSKQRKYNLRSTSYLQTQLCKCLKHHLATWTNSQSANYYWKEPAIFPHLGLLTFLAIPQALQAEKSDKQQNFLHTDTMGCILPLVMVREQRSSQIICAWSERSLKYCIILLQAKCKYEEKCMLNRQMAP